MFRGILNPKNEKELTQQALTEWTRDAQNVIDYNTLKKFNNKYVEIYVDKSFYYEYYDDSKKEIISEEKIIYGVFYFDEPKFLGTGNVNLKLIKIGENSNFISNHVIYSIDKKLIKLIKKIKLLDNNIYDYENNKVILNPDEDTNISRFLKLGYDIDVIKGIINKYISTEGVVKKHVEIEYYDNDLNLTKIDGYYNRLGTETITKLLKNVKGGENQGKVHGQLCKKYIHIYDIHDIHDINNKKSIKIFLNDIIKISDFKLYTIVEEDEEIEGGKRRKSIKQKNKKRKTKKTRKNKKTYKSKK
jgi:hypothetical protein